MKFRYLLFIVFCAVIWTGCYNEKDIVPTEGSEMMYSLPQGNHEYDKDIVAWFDKYGFYTVYDFKIGDLYWANTAWEEQVEPNLGGYLSAKQADPEHVGPVLEMFQELFLDYYSEDMLKENMPLKVFLCSELWKGSWKMNYLTGKMERGDSVELMAYKGYDYIALNGAREDFEITESVKSDFLREVNKVFINILTTKGLFSIPEEFLQVADYKVPNPTAWPGSPTAIPGPSNSVFALGYLNVQTVKSSFVLTEMQEKDFAFYMDLVMSYSMAELESETANWSMYDNQSYMDYTGILYPQRGYDKVRQKYEILVDYIESFGLSLDRIRFPERFATGEGE